MAKTISIELTDEQAQALEDYAAHGNNLEWYRDEKLGQNMPRRKYEDGAAVLADGLAKFLAGVVAQCPPQSVKDAQAQMEQLKATVDAASRLSINSVRIAR